MKDWDMRPARDLEKPLAEQLRSLERENGLISTGLNWAWWTFVRVYMGIYHRLTIHGRKHLPARPPFVLIANHASHLDALVLACPLSLWQRDRIFPIAAGDVFFETPMMTGFAAFLLNALPMWRKKCGPHALKVLRRRLVEEPCGYILFPEGKRTRDGQMLPFKPGLGMLVAETDVPVIPCYIHGSFEALHADHQWPRPGRITMTVGEAMNFAAVKNDRDGWMEIAERTQERVKRLGG
jgi:1-acyl-sn-glycerol-3-phosphate acyltransferase